MTTQVETIASLFDYFHERVEETRADDGAALSSETRLYLVQLLTERARSDATPARSETLAELHARAATAPPAEQARTYRQLGDRALYDLGYFQERLERGIVSLDYYENMGTAAYAQVDQVLKRWFADAFGEVFEELAGRFRTCVSVLSGVRHAHDAEADLTALYQTWLESGDEEVARKLRRLGLVIPRNRPDA